MFFCFFGGKECGEEVFLAMMKGSFLASVKFALEGVFVFFTTEKNGQRQLFVAVVALLAGWLFGISRGEWLWLVGSVTGVFAAEMVNTAIEKFCDLVTTEVRPEIKLIKDLSAGSVLLVAVGATIVGIIIFIPYVLALL